MDLFLFLFFFFFFFFAVLSATGSTTLADYEHRLRHHCGLDCKRGRSADNNNDLHGNCIIAFTKFADHGNDKHDHCMIALTLRSELLLNGKLCTLKLKQDQLTKGETCQLKQ